MTIQKIGALCLPRSTKNQNDMNNNEFLENYPSNIYNMKHPYCIVFHGPDGKELVDRAENYEEAKFMLKEYKTAFKSDALTIVHLGRRIMANVGSAIGLHK
tara:strand:+ start:9198 stop:9500 length:303 start_codon:yes stop_codon:yes gene_type:complete